MLWPVTIWHFTVIRKHGRPVGPGLLFIVLLMQGKGVQRSIVVDTRLIGMQDHAPEKIPEPSHSNETPRRDQSI